MVSQTLKLLLHEAITSVQTIPTFLTVLQCLITNYHNIQTYPTILFIGQTLLFFPRKKIELVSCFIILIAVTIIESLTQTRADLIRKLSERGDHYIQVSEEFIGIKPEYVIHINTKYS